MSITSQSLQDDDGIGERFHLFFIDPRQLSLYYEATSHLGPEPNFLCDHLGPFVPQSGCHTARYIRSTSWPCLVMASQLRKGKTVLRTVMAAFVHFQNWSVENVIGVV